MNETEEDFEKITDMILDGYRVIDCPFCKSKMHYVDGSGRYRMYYRMYKCGVCEKTYLHIRKGTDKWEKMEASK